MNARTVRLKISGTLQRLGRAEGDTLSDRWPAGAVAIARQVAGAIQVAGV